MRPKPAATVPSRRYNGIMATRPRFGVDRGLEFRMVVTVAALTVVYIAFLVALIFSGVGALVTLAFCAGLLVVQLRSSRRLALRAMRAREVERDADPELHAIVDRLCLHADLPRPRIAIGEVAVPNAMVVGLRRGGMTLCVTRRARELLDLAELEAVVAHELGHVANRDAIVMTVAAFWGMLAGLVWRIGFRVGHPLMRLVAVGVTVLASALSFVLLRALSRQREFAADRAAAVLTGRPSALASALLKVDGQLATARGKDLRALEPVGALCLMPLPAVRRTWARVAATHPSTAARVAALERLEAQLQRPGR
jgi:heat shock protein HtpX